MPTTASSTFLNMVACYSAAGGAGTTVFASCLALTLATNHPPGVLFIDLAGDVPAALGMVDDTLSSRPGVAELLGSSLADVATVRRSEIPARRGLDVLHRGTTPEGKSHPFADDTQAKALISLLAHDSRLVVVDCGTRPAGLAAGIARAADRSLLVTRQCYLALRRARQLSVRPTGVVVLREPGRALTARDVERTAHAPVVAHVEYDPGLSRAVDAGLLSARQLPRSTKAALRPICRDILGQHTRSAGSA